MYKHTIRINDGTHALSRRDDTLGERICFNTRVLVANYTFSRKYTTNGNDLNYVIYCDIYPFYSHIDKFETYFS